MSEEAKWYVVHTYSGYENKVATNIEKAVENRGMHELIQEVKVPTETVTEIKDNKKREVERKIFPGYVLIKMIMTDLVYRPQYPRLYRFCRTFVQADPADRKGSGGTGRGKTSDRGQLWRW